MGIEAQGESEGDSMRESPASTTKKKTIPAIVRERANIDAFERRRIPLAGASQYRFAASFPISSRLVSSELSLARSLPFRPSQMSCLALRDPSESPPRLFESLENRIPRCRSEMVFTLLMSLPARSAMSFSRRSSSASTPPAERTDLTSAAEGASLPARVRRR